MCTDKNKLSLKFIYCLHNYSILAFRPVGFHQFLLLKHKWFKANLHAHLLLPNSILCCPIFAVRPKIQVKKKKKHEQQQRISRKVCVGNSTQHNTINPLSTRKHLYICLDPGVRHPCAMFILPEHFCCVNNKVKCQQQEQRNFVAQFSISRGNFVHFNVEVLGF